MVLISIASIHTRVISSSSVNHLSAKNKENITAFIYCPASVDTYSKSYDEKILVSYRSLLTLSFWKLSKV